MPHFIFSSHDGYGLGHVRRNTLIARALLAACPDATATIVTGIPRRPAWLVGEERLDVVSVPQLVKDAEGVYANPGMSFESAIRARAEAFDRVVLATRPDVVVVDRHPFGIAGELRSGLAAARAAGARTVLGLRDVLDDAAAVRIELEGAGWDGVDEAYDEVLVYGDPILCDHEREYGLPLAPTYCGWVTERPAAAVVEHDLVLVAAGGGGDGQAVRTLGVELLLRRADRRGILIAGPYAQATAVHAELAERLVVTSEAPGCAPLLARAGAVVMMAGYNTTSEALAAGVRPILMPRRSPRREQAIRALRLAALGLADVVDHGADAGEVAWLLDRPRRLAPGAVEAAGIHLDGAERAAQRLLAAVGSAA